MKVRLETLASWTDAVAADPMAAAHQRTVVVASGTHGSGASTIAALIALSCAAEGRRTRLVDGADGMATLRTLVGAREDEAMGDATDDPPRSDDEMVLIDSGSTLAQLSLAAGPAASRCLVLAGVTPSEHASAYAVAKALSAQQPRIPIDIVMNRQDLNQAQRTFQQVHNAATRFLQRELYAGGIIPDDPLVRAASATGRSLVALGSRSRAGQAAHVLAARLLAAFDDDAAAPAAARTDQGFAGGASRHGVPHMLERRP